MRKFVFFILLVVIMGSSIQAASTDVSFMETEVDPVTLVTLDSCPMRSRFRGGNLERSLLFDRASCVMSTLLKKKELWQDQKYQLKYKNYQQQLKDKLKKKRKDVKTKGLDGLKQLFELMNQVADLANEKMLSDLDSIQGYELYYSRQTSQSINQPAKTRASFLAHLTHALKPVVRELQELRDEKRVSFFPSPCPCHGNQAVGISVLALQDKEAAPTISKPQGISRTTKVIFAIAGALFTEAMMRKERSVLWNGLRIGKGAVMAFWRWVTGQWAATQRTAMPTYRESLSVARELIVAED
ncbi:MAG: hypothetical protein QG632_725 [Candidatus Dependentiae bacterium]|nr:hypothetical protein [Candidatus Dependentiae bacterium]